MRSTRIVMGMPVTVQIVRAADACPIERIFAYFADVDRRFSTYRGDSEIAAINRGEIKISDCSEPMREVLALVEKTRNETEGFFDIRRADGTLDPSGLVKGWAIRNAAAMVAADGYRNFFIDAGGDIQSAGTNGAGAQWSVGIRNPFDAAEIIKIVYPRGAGVATSGTSARGQHIYNPHRRSHPIDEIVSMTVIGSDVLEADRFATAAFAMGRKGIDFVEALPGLEGYLVHADRKATLTSGFGDYCSP